ncbi:hypothetical protein [Bosea sp. NBC_00550]|uniref:hypothetical protein n=1 Tax=Bosea sp. NBC_00550 TaxID=2969621 RepID=UPI00222F5306|nr:hypothetical protein [Bosea sp. NBC_00550]UZF90232.1 hypothetical protein NWE53_13830 [Bosea sp. NBC_00550]
MDDPRKNTDGDDPFALDPALQEKARRWFAEAREQTKRDDEEIAAWRSDARPTGGDGGSGGFGGDGGGDCGGGD